jgi:hypothetical protein
MLTVTSRPQPVFARMYEVREESNQKIVPGGYNLDRTTLLYWYRSYRNCSSRKRGAPRICFATHRFPEKSVYHLQAEVD